jgi:prepilin-type N-terminal cleavage/methylation domain-containing protein
MRPSSIRLKFGHIRGMTLLEMLVALLLLAALSIGILAALRTEHRTYSMILRSDRGSSDVAVTQRLLRRIIESAYPIVAAATKTLGGFGLEGTREALFLTAPMSQASGAAGLYRYELTLQPRSDGANDLVLRHHLDREGTAAESGRGAESDTEKEILLERVRAVRYEYLAKPEPDNTGSASLPRWADSWHDATLPMLVRSTVDFDPGDLRRWPVLVIAPHLTDDAQCVFDVISGSCRQGP